MNLFKHVEGGKTYAVGSTIFAQGDAPGGFMYVVQEGEIDIVANGNCIETIGIGSLLGEIGLVDNQPRTASAIAKTECRVLPIDQKRFNFLLQQTPHFALQVMQIMAQRLRESRSV